MIANRHYFFVLAVLGALIASSCGKGTQAAGSHSFDPASYQAVFLDNGQTFFGHVTSLDQDLVGVSDVFYVQQNVNPETKAVSNTLVRRGKEWHAPDRMIVNRRHIVLIETVTPLSRVAELIAALKGK